MALSSSLSLSLSSCQVALLSMCMFAHRLQGASYTPARLSLCLYLLSCMTHALPIYVAIHVHIPVSISQNHFPFACSFVLPRILYLFLVPFSWQQGDR
ncbi:hypothetical protein HDK90DRAFT_269308 [Phyllosticta capitalensis]|uniref:Secreted peptide n=1 Tax=Phyllosticta capitalensis TaxID=121624 RepID=A0ABR1YLX7_9PEZI